MDRALFMYFWVLKVCNYITFQCKALLSILFSLQNHGAVPIWPSRLVQADHRNRVYRSYSPWLPQPVDGQFADFSPEIHAPFQSGEPSEPDHCEHDTSWNEPVSAPCPIVKSLVTTNHLVNSPKNSPLGKNALAPPVSSQMSKLEFRSCQSARRFAFS